MPTEQNNIEERHARIDRMVADLARVATDVREKAPRVAAGVGDSSRTVDAPGKGDATTASPLTCFRCGAVKGTKTGHHLDLVIYRCDECGAQFTLETLKA